MLSKLTTISGVFLALTAFTVGVALYFRNPLLVYTSVFLVITNIVLFIWAQYSVRGLELKREHPPLAVAGRPLEVGVSLTNNQHTTRFGLIGFDLHGELTPGKDYTPVAFFEAHPGKPVQANYEFTPERRGLFKVGPFFLYGGDPFGFYKCWRKMDRQSTLTVLPNPVPFAFTHTRSASFLAQDELETVAQPGESTEFMGVREYRQGEPLKRIHWPTSARLGTLISRQHELNVAPSVSALLLSEREMLRGSKAHNPLEYSITMIASLAQATCFEKFHLSYLALMGNQHEFAKGTGPRFSQELAVRLAHLEGVGALDWEHHGRQILATLPATSDLVVFTATLDDEWRERLKHLAVHFRSLSVVTFNLRSFDLGKPLDQIAARLSIGDGYIVHEVSCGSSLRQVLEAVLGSAASLQGGGR